MRPLPAMAALLAFPLVLAACGTGEAAGPSLVADFPLGADTTEAREFVLTPTPGIRVRILPATPMTVPDPGGVVPPELSHTPAPTPGSGGRSPVEAAHRPTVAWVNDGRYLAVVTFGSGSCPSGPTSIEVMADQEIDVRLGPLVHDGDVCSADMRGHVTVVELPSGITPTKPLVAGFGNNEATIEAVGR